MAVFSTPGKSVGEVAQIACDEARKVGIPLARVSDGAFNSHFAQYFCRDKYDISAVLASQFPELAWRVPARPNFYDPERCSMLYFDSIALGIAYLELTEGNHENHVSGDGILSPDSK